MKISPQLITSSNALWLSAILSSAVLATGCQSTSLAQPHTINNYQTPMAAKTALADALQQQRRQSFAYHSNIEMSNQQPLTNVDSHALVVAEEVSAHCETVHDKGYVDLLAQAEAQNKDIEAIDFAEPRQRLKDAYLECAQAYEAWATDKYNSEYGSGYDAEDSYSDGIEDDATASRYLEYDATEAYGNEGTTISETSTIKGGAVIKSGAVTQAAATATHTGVVSPDYQQLFDEYEDKLSALDIKKSQLRDAYLLKPLSINAQGIYQPLAGKFTMLGSVQYQTRNHNTNINQPIYVDFKTGSIYFWADNLAMLTSEVLDDKLGTQWQNKWLKLAIDDGSLPKGFGRAMIQSHFEALDRAYESAAVSQFDFVTPNTLTTLAPKLPEHHLSAMLQSQQIIRRIQSPESYQQFYQDYMSDLYKRITTQYPELINEDSEGWAASMANGAPLTTKAIVMQMLATMQTVIAHKIPADTEKDAGEITAALASRGSIQSLYGLNKRGQIQWQHLRQQASNKQSPSRALTTDVLQQYTPMNAQTLAFPNLPATMQVPNASNSVDVREYSKALMDYYRAGNGTTLGKTLFNMLPATLATTVADLE